MPYSVSDWKGRVATRRIRITPEMIDAFVGVSTDSSPIHVSHEAALARGFPTRVAHGLLLGALISGVIGTDLPGAEGVLQKVQLSFLRPCFVDDEVVIALEVIDFFESVQVLQLRVAVTNQDGVVVVSGTVQSGVGALS